MTIRIIVLLLAVLQLGVLWSPSAHSRPAAAVDRPNIVFIISDDHRWDALGAAGNAAIKTPVLDRLAREGVYFRQATIHVSQCAPSRAVLLTGLPPHQSGYYANNFLRSDLEWADRFQVPTMPGLLQQAGYRTVLVGKWHLGTDPWHSGFSDVRTWLPEGGSSYADSALARGNSRETKIIKGFTNGVFADDAVAFLATAEAKQAPFLLWLATTAPHSPYQPNPAHIDHLYEGASSDSLPPPPAFPKGGTVDVSLPGDGSGAETGLADYYASVSYLDELAGRVLAALDEQGLAENTIVVFLGDNGLMAGSRGVRGKVVPYEESVRVPMIIRAPQLATVSGRSDAAASSLDLAPTILAMAGVTPPAQWSGRDLRPVLTGAKRHGIDYAVSEWADTESQFGHFTHRLIRTPRHKLIRWRDPERADELYDLVADPHEATNLAAEPAYRATRDRLLGLLTAWMKRTDDSALGWDAKIPGTSRQAALAGIEKDRRAAIDDKRPAHAQPLNPASYVGRYEFVTRGMTSVSQEGGRLFVAEFGGKSELIPKSETEFVHKTRRVQYTFLRNEEGKVTHLVRRFTRSEDERSFDMKARKID